jgi:hypothetical protein
MQLLGSTIDDGDSGTTVFAGSVGTVSVQAAATTSAVVARADGMRWMKPARLPARVMTERMISSPERSSALVRVDRFVEGISLTPTRQRSWRRIDAREDARATHAVITKASPLRR